MTLKTTAQVKSAIKSIKTTGAKLQQAIHETGMQCLHHAQQHGDTTLLASLVDAMPRSTRREDFKLWVHAHSPLTVSFNKKEGKHEVKGKNITDAANWKLEEAEATPFWDFTEDKPSKLYTPEAMMHALRAIAVRAEKEAAKQKEQGETDEEAVARIAQLEAMSVQVNQFASSLN